MGGLPFDAQERLELCALLDELGPSAPTLLDGWTTHDLAAHIVLREHDLLAAPCLVLPGPFRRFAEGRRAKLANRHDFTWLVARIRSGPPPGFFRIGWVRSFPNLNEFFVHHEDVRRATDVWQPRPYDERLEQAMWRIVRSRGRAFFRKATLGVALALPDGTTHVANNGQPSVTVTGPASELVLYSFGRTGHALVEITGDEGDVEAFSSTPLAV